MTLPQKGMFSRGMKIPLMNTSGNLTSDETIITLEGTLVGGVASRRPKAEKHKEAKIIPKTNIIGWNILTPRIKPISTGTSDIKVPKITDASISPRIKVDMEMGQDINLSRVFICDSQGVITGDTEVAVKSMVIPIRPATRKSIGKFLLPLRKAKNRNNGINIPKIITGPLR